MDYKEELIKSIKQQEKMKASLMYSKLTNNLKEDKDIAISAITTDILSVSYLPDSLKNDLHFLNSFKVIF